MRKKVTYTIVVFMLICIITLGFFAVDPAGGYSSSTFSPTALSVFLVLFPFSSGPWTVTEFSDSRIVLKYAIESPDEKDHQTMVLKRVE